MDAWTDGEAMAQVAAGRAQALSGLFERHHGQLYGFLYRVTGQGALSEDLTQEVFLRVLRYAASFKAGSAFRPWLYRIARNVLADHWGRSRPESPLEIHAGDLFASGPCPQAGLEAAQDHDRLGLALARLPLAKRELLLLSRDPELSYTELAELYSCSVTALKVRVHRALQELRGHFFAGPGAPAEPNVVLEVR